MSSELIELDLNEETRAEQLHNESTVVDGLLPGLLFLQNEGYRNNLQQGGIDAANFTVSTKENFEEAAKRVQSVHNLMSENPEKLIVETVADIHSAKENDEVGVIIGFQGTRPIEWNLEYLRAFYQMGVRIIQLTYNSQNAVGTGCWERNDAGLSHYGRDVVDEMNELGILIDLSHCNDATTMETIEYSADPVAFTHVGVRSIGHAYGRGKTDEQMKAVAENGGVVGITFHPPFIKKDPQNHEVLNATIDDVLDHIDYVVDLVGVDHVGFGSDMNDKTYDNPDSDESWISLLSDRHLEIRAENEHVFGATDPREYDPISGLDRSTKFQNITRGLVSRGYSDNEIRKIMGENFIELFENVWN